MSEVIVLDSANQVPIGEDSIIMTPTPSGAWEVSTSVADVDSALSRWRKVAAYEVALMDAKRLADKNKIRQIFVIGGNA